MTHRGISALLTGILVMGGCVHPTAPDEDTLSVDMPAEWTAAELGDAISTNWLDDFNDPQLSGIVEEALSGNLPFQAAMARLDQAMALARIEGADQWPDLAIGASARRQMSNNLQEPVFRNRSDRFDLGATVNWEIDLWGRIRARTMAANADAAAAQADFLAVELSLASRVAQAWFSAIETRLQEALALETLTSFEDNQTTVEERYQRGLSPALDLRLTRANVASARAVFSQRRRLTDLAIRQLEVLLGRYPSAELEIPATLPEISSPVPAGLPSDLLMRRPDILGASQRLIAADARLIESRRTLLPAISLTGTYGRASNELENLLEDSFDVWSLLGNLTAPVFQGGRLRANVDLSAARFEEMVANYRDTVLIAFREVESSLAGEVYLAEQLMAARMSAEESVGAQQLAEERYERGLADIITVLESQRRAFTSQSTVLEIENQILQNRLSLYLALGGGIQSE